MSRYTAIAGLALGLLIALAANLTYAVPRGPVTVGLGLIAPLVLPVALYIRTTFTATNGWQVGCRELATIAVAGPAAAISYVHTYELVLSVHEPWILAVLAPLSSDGLAGMATLALHRHRQAAPSPKVAAPPRRKPEQPATAPEPEVPVAKPDDLTPRRIERDQSRRDQGKDWARKNWPVTGGQIATAVGVGRSEGDRIRAAVKAEKERAS
jgi:hypothetical protein